MAFIPALHFEPSENKFKKEWWKQVTQFYVYQNKLTGLLDNKDVEEIQRYAAGDYDIAPFKRLFRSLRLQEARKNDPNVRMSDLSSLDKTGISWEPVPLIPPKLNSAVATTQKIPIEITCICTDPLAQKKKKEDLEFLRNKPMIEDAMQPLYDELNLGQVDAGSTKYSDVPYTALPLDLDPDDEQEFMIFANLIYNLAPESAFETILQSWYDVKKMVHVKHKEIKDQYLYAVSVNRVYKDRMTMLPDFEYIMPECVETDGSILPDFSDNTIRIVNLWVTPMELFKYFPDEIKSEADLEKIVGVNGGNGWESSYCCRNRRDSISRNEWNTFRMNLKYIEVKSVDSVSIGQKPKSRFVYPTTDDDPHVKRKVWGQNTYCAYWLWNTEYFFGMDKLGFAYRSAGSEVYQNFSTNIYKSNDKSAVELSIPENKKAQIADVKLQHAIINALPEGKVIDMKYVRNAIEGMKEEFGEYTMKQILDMAMESNVHIIDSAGFEGMSNSSQQVAVHQLPGGLPKSIEGYYRVLLEADAKIAQYTNINHQLTGQSANPEGLIGLQKLLINSSLNGLYYVNEAISAQYQSVMNILAWYIKEAIENGGASRKAIENIIGSNKAEVIDNMDEIPLHQIGVKITLGQREEERAMFRAELSKMRQEGRIRAIEEYFILNTPNPKDAMLLLSLFERRAQKREDQIRQEQMQSQQQIVEQQGQNVLANTQAQSQAKIQQIQAQGSVQAELMKLGGQLGMTMEQIQGLIKLRLQNDRLDKQTEKALKTLYAKSNSESQQPITA